MDANITRAAPSACNALDNIACIQYRLSLLSLCWRLAHQPRASPSPSSRQNPSRNVQTAPRPLHPRNHAAENDARRPKKRKGHFSERTALGQRSAAQIPLSVLSLSCCCRLRHAGLASRRRCDPTSSSGKQLACAGNRKDGRALGGGIALWEKVHQSGRRSRRRVLVDSAAARRPTPGVQTGFRSRFSHPWSRSRPVHALGIRHADQFVPRFRRCFADADNVACHGLLRTP